MIHEFPAMARNWNGGMQRAREDRRGGKSEEDAPECFSFFLPPLPQAPESHSFSYLDIFDTTILKCHFDLTVFKFISGALLIPLHY